ncbi:MAG: DUF1579 domain-containing protein [Fimbriiglobus sp.]
MQAPTPLPQHQWLDRMIGEWTYTSECQMGPDQPPMRSSGSSVVRSLGGLWSVAEGLDEHGTSLLTIGYDPVQERFVGSFIASMMTHHWLYSGSLDASGQVLTLDAEGPTFTGDGSMAWYQDIFESVNDNTRTLKSRMKMPDGSYMQFMHATYTRKK